MTSKIHHHTASTDLDTNDRLDSSGLLRSTLRVNAALSACSGIVLAIIPGRIDDVLDTGHPGWVRFVGIAFVVFAVDVAWLSLQQVAALRTFTPVVVAMDASYVGASLVTVAVGWYSTGGAVLVAVGAAPVAGFAVLQFLGWQRLR